MKTSYKRAWVEALRSGEYKQAQRQLCTVNGDMCCLGVLIDTTIDGDWTLQRRRPNRTRYAFDGNGLDLNPDLRDRVGLSLSDQDTLVHLNDSVGASFLAIADWIEDNL